MSLSRSEDSSTVTPMRPERTQRRVSIGLVLNVYSVLLAVLPIVIIVLVINNLFGEQVREQAIARMDAVGISRDKEIERWLDSGIVQLNGVLANTEQQRDIQALVQSAFVSDGIRRGVQVFLSDQLAVQDVFVEYLIYDDTRLRLSTDPDRTVEVDITDQPYHDMSITEPRIVPPFYNEEADRLEIMVLTPVFRTEAGGGVVGVLAGRLDLDALGAILEANIGFGETGETYLISQDRTFITPSRFGDYSPTDRVNSVGIDSALRGFPGNGTYRNYLRSRVIGVYRPIEELNAALLAEIEEDEALGALNNALQASLLIAIIAAAGALVIGRGVTLWLKRPIDRLTEVARAVMRGDYSRRAGLPVVSEIGELGLAMDTMTDNLTQTIGERNARIEQAEMLSATLESRVEARTRELRAAAEVAKQIANVLDIEKLLQRVAQLTVASFGLYACIVYRYDEDQNVLRYAASADDGAQPINPQDIEVLALSDRRGIIVKAARTRRTVLSNDVTDSLDYRPIPQLPRTAAELAIPMRLGDHILGIFDVQSRTPNRFSDDDVAVLTTLAEQTSIALRNAQLFAETRAARQEAEEANRVKSQFLANMSHELRTPLNAILNFAEFMADGDLGEVNDDQVDALNKVISSGEHLLSLINDVLDITKIEVGMLELFIEQVDVNKSLASIVSTGKGLLKESEVELVVDVQPDLPLIRGDRRRLHQVFLNLLSNAVKFTPSGTINIRAWQEGDDIRVSVSDTGVGIAPEEQATVFDSFRQSESGKRSGSGTGLGLPISRHFVQAHGGELWLESAVNEGSTFHVRLPVTGQDPTNTDGA